MTFLQINKPDRTVPAEGPKDAKIVIVGEAPGSYESAQLRPFVGPAGTVLEQCLHAAGLIRSDVYLTNVVKVQPKGNNIAPYFSSDKGTFTALGMESVQALRAELDGLSPNIIVACGATAFAALCGASKILKYRGYVFESKGLKDTRKVIPTIHPAASLRGQYIFRHLIATDLKKARVEAEFPDLRRPKRQLIFDFGSVEEALAWIKYYEEASVVCFDTEVLNFELACIGFSSNPDVACSIPVADRWTVEEEAQIMRGVQRVLGNPLSIKIAQNGIFDTHFLLTRCGVVTRGPLHDTMVAHSIMYPELNKGLGFLGSLYCGAQSYWKDSVKFNNIKGDA